ncbi:MAG: hypothetical protein U9N18_06940 [Campylobacterota bacterium]|nr:hypothetical protein [Campylobacterota bacterium]
MADTTMKEHIAEDLITSELQRSGIYITKPKFDTDGTDLFAMLKIPSNTGNIIFKYCRIQCKYRSVEFGKKNIVEIPDQYIKPDFIVFLYVEDGDITKHQLFCFFWEDIKAKSSPWYLKGGNFILSIKMSNFKEILKKYVFDQTKVDEIKQRIQTSSTVIENIHIFAELILPPLEANMNIISTSDKVE